MKIRRKLVATTPADPTLQTGLVLGLYYASRVEDTADAIDAVKEALDIVLRLEEQGALLGDQKSWPGLLRRVLADLRAEVDAE